MSNSKTADLKAFKINVLSDFEDTVSQEILTRIGYYRYFKDVQNHDQESLMRI